MDEFHETKDRFDHPYYRIVKVLGIVTGQWPYGGRPNNIMLYVVIIGGTFQMLTQFLGFVHYSDDPDIILSMLPPTILECACLWKLMNTLMQSTKMKQLLDLIKEDWNLVNNEELRILHEYAYIGKLFATGYAAFAFSTLFIFETEPILDDMLGKMLDQNYTTPEQGFYPVAAYFFGLNKGKNYYVTLIASYFNSVAICTVSISQDTLFIIFLQHVCGRFAALGYSVQNLPILNDNSRDDGFEYVRECIKIHKRTIKFSEIVESVYVWYFLGVVSCNMVNMSMTAVLAATEAENIQVAMKLVLLLILQILHLFFECYMSQQLLDHSEHIQICIGNALWYKHSLKTQKMLTFMLMRSQIPCRLTAGKILEMSMMTFSSICKTSASYFTVFRSMQ